MDGTVVRGLPGPELSGTLWRTYGEWLRSGVPSDRILALLDSATRTSWTALLKGEPEEHIAPGSRPKTPVEPFTLATGAQRFDTPNAWIRKELDRWWPVVDARLTAMGLPAARPVATPLVVDVTIAQHLLERFSAELRPPVGTLLESSETDRLFQNIQMLDALSRGIEHGASLAAVDDGTPIEGLVAPIIRKLKDGGDPSPDAQRRLDEMGQVLVRYASGMLTHRILDFALALDCYTALLWPHPAYRTYFLSGTTHLLVENLDEWPPRLLSWIEEVGESGPILFATRQGEPEPGSFAGGLREHLGADPIGAEALASRLTSLPPDASDPPFHGVGRALYDAVLGHVAKIDRPVDLMIRLDHLTYGDMLDVVLAELMGLLQDVPPDEVALVVPTLDPLVIWLVRHKLEQIGRSLYVFAGTNRLTDYRPVRVLLTLTKLAHPAWGLVPTTFELQELVEQVTRLDPFRMGRVADRLLMNGSLVATDWLGALLPELGDRGRECYDRLVRWLDEMGSHGLPDLHLFLQDAFARVYVPSLQLPPDGRDPDERAQREISQIGQLIDLARKFQEADRRVAGSDDAAWGRRFMEHLAGNPIAERPFFKREPRRDALMLSTAHQLAERGFRATGDRLEHLFVLDLGAETWWKPDRRELTNPWVLSRHWPGGRFTEEDAQERMNLKLARVLFSLCLKPRSSLRLHACLTDAEGRENLGELPGMIEEIVGRTPTRARA